MIGLFLNQVYGVLIEKWRFNYNKGLSKRKYHQSVLLRDRQNH